jgi:hypothetical protein
LDLVKRGVPNHDMSRYAYASMSGKFMDDLKLAHRVLKITKLYSIEQDRIVFGRQLFNKPLSWIQCRLQSSEDFIDNFDTLCEELGYPKFIVWLDFAAANKRGAQLSELQALIAKLADYDVVKITLNADIRTLLSTPADESDQQISVQAADRAREDALAKLSRQLGEFCPSDINLDHMRNDGLPNLLAESVRIAAVKGMTGQPRSRIIPLTINRYSDGHQMLTVTAIVLPKDAEEDFWSDTKLQTWPFISNDWNKIHSITVPDLSFREKLEIDQKLGKNTAERIHSWMPFKFHGRRERSLEILKAYIEHHERYPSFGRYIT